MESKQRTQLELLSAVVLLLLLPPLLLLLLLLPHRGSGAVAACMAVASTRLVAVPRLVLMPLSKRVLAGYYNCRQT